MLRRFCDTPLPLAILHQHVKASNHIYLCKVAPRVRLALQMVDIEGLDMLNETIVLRVIRQFSSPVPQIAVHADLQKGGRCRKSVGV